MSSFVINSLKSVKEQLTDNYSSYELLTTLDTLLIYAITPILENTRYVERSLSLLSGWYVNAARRKIASLDTKDEFNTIAAQLIIAQNLPDRKLLWQKLRLERTITFWMLHDWLRIMQPWVKARTLNDYDAMHSSCRKGCFISYDHVFTTIQTVDYWLNAAVNFKQQIMEKYMRLVMLEATSYASFQKKNNPHLNIQLDDVAQNFVLALSKAIDKCDANRGTLTSYIKTWLKDARNTTSFSHEYGVAYSIPTGKKRDIARHTSSINNISISLDSDEAQEMPSSFDTEASAVSSHVVNRVRRLAKAADPLGLGRAALQITEVLSPDELTLLKQME